MARSVVLHYMADVKQDLNDPTVIQENKEHGEDSLRLHIITCSQFDDDNLWHERPVAVLEVYEGGRLDTVLYSNDRISNTVEHKYGGDLINFLDSYGAPLFGATDVTLKEFMKEMRSVPWSSWTLLQRELSRVLGNMENING